MNREQLINALTDMLQKQHEANVVMMKLKIVLMVVRMMILMMVTMMMTMVNDDDDGADRR